LSEFPAIFTYLRCRKKAKMDVKTIDTRRPIPIPTTAACPTDAPDVDVSVVLPGILLFVVVDAGLEVAGPVVEDADVTEVTGDDV